MSGLKKKRKLSSSSFLQDAGESSKGTLQHDISNNESPTEQPAKKHQHQQTSKPTSSTSSLVLDNFRRNLPVYKYRNQILQLVRQNDVVFISADTGSGKSTQIASFLHDCGITSSKSSYIVHPFNNRTVYLGRTIAVTQPRRVAAITVAKRVAEEMGCTVGTLVGHRVRFDDCSDHQGPNSTRILYVTDGMLLREAMADPLLTRYCVVILDEG